MYGAKSEERRDDVDDAAVRGAYGRDTHNYVDDVERSDTMKTKRHYDIY